MKIRGLYAGLPGMTSFNPLLPDEGDGTSGATTGGGGAPAVPATPTAPPTPVTPPATAAPATPAAGDTGFPANTPVAEMTDAQRAAYHRHYAVQHRAERDELAAWKAANEAKVAQYEALEAASKTETERAIEAARTEAAAAAKAEALAEARKTYGVPAVQARLDAALDAKGLTAEQMKVLVPDPARFLGADGVDTTALTAFLVALPDKAAAPAATRVDLGGGRTTPVGTAGVEAGAALYEARKSKPRA